MAFPSQRGFLYSNYAYGVAEAVLERASGESYARLLQSRLFDPLGMHDGAPVLNTRLAREAAREYDGARNLLEPSRFIPAGGAGAFAVRTSRSPASWTDTFSPMRPGLVHCLSPLVASTQKMCPLSRWDMPNSRWSQVP